MRFEWDENKNKENIRNHGLDFKDARAVFDGPHFAFDDLRFDYSEARSITIGFSKNRVVVVAYAQLEDSTRINSMRKANAKEKRSSQSDWARVDGMNDADIDYSEIAELDDKFLKKAQLILPENKVKVTMRLDPEVLNWFKNQGKGYQTKINAVLKSYIQAHSKAS